MVIIHPHTLTQRSWWSHRWSYSPRVRLLESREMFGFYWWLSLNGFGDFFKSVFTLLFWFGSSFCSLPLLLTLCSVGGSRWSRFEHDWCSCLRGWSGCVPGSWPVPTTLNLSDSGHSKRCGWPLLIPTSSSSLLLLYLFPSCHILLFLHLLHILHPFQVNLLLIKCVVLIKPIPHLIRLDLKTLMEFWVWKIGKIRHLKLQMRPLHLLFIRLHKAWVPFKRKLLPRRLPRGSNQLTSFDCFSLIHCFNYIILN